MLRRIGHRAEKRERGQGTLEAAIAVPIVTFVLLAIIQVGMYIFAGNSLTSAVSYAQYAVTSSDVAGAADVSLGNGKTGKSAQEALYNRIVQASPMLANNPDGIGFGVLEVSDDASYYSWTDYYIEPLPNPDDDWIYGFSAKSEYTVRGVVSGTVTYKPTRIFAIVPEVTFTRVIDAGRIVSETFELS